MLNPNQDLNNSQPHILQYWLLVGHVSRCQTYMGRRTCAHICRPLFFALHKIRSCCSSTLV
jgi:hypothetical protein